MKMIVMYEHNLILFVCMYMCVCVCVYTGPSRDGPGPRAGTVMGPHFRRLRKPFLGYALSNAVRWTVRGMNFEINAPETLEFVF